MSQFPHAYRCDHGNTDECERCEMLNLWLGVRNALLLAAPVWLAIIAFVLLAVWLYRGAQ